MTLEGGTSGSAVPALLLKAMRKWVKPGGQLRHHLFSRFINTIPSHSCFYAASKSELSSEHIISVEEDKVIVHPTRQKEKNTKKIAYSAPTGLIFHGKTKKSVPVSQNWFW